MTGKLVLVLAAALSLGTDSLGQVVTVTTAADVIDVNTQTATVADLPGPDGKVSFSEAMIATNNTPGHQTVGFAIPQSEWTLQFVLPGRAVLTSSVGFYFRAFDAVTIDGTTQTAFTGDTNPDGWEVALYGVSLYLNADQCTLLGFDSSNVVATGSNCTIQGNTGSMNIELFGGSGSLIDGNEGGTIKIDRSSGNVVTGNKVGRVRVLGFDPLAANNRIGGPNPEDRNHIYGYGTTNSEGLPSGAAVQLFYTTGTVVENNWIGTLDGLTSGNLACTIGVSVESRNDDVRIEGNLISGIIGKGTGPHHGGQLFGRGVLASGLGAGLTLVGNTIGPDVNGDPTLGAVWGIDLGDPVTHPLQMTDIVIGGPGPGEGNEIAGHVFNGVTVGRNTGAVRMTGNSIHDNGWLGIDLVPTGYGYGVSPNDPLDADTGGSTMQNFPVLDSARRGTSTVRFAGSLSSSPSDTFTIEFFASPTCDPSGNGEGETPLGATAVTTNASGLAAFDVTLGAVVPAGWVATATATREPVGATSEFSACIPFADDVCQDDLGFAGPGDTVLGLCGQALDSGNRATLSLIQATALSPAMFVIGTQSQPTPFLNGVLVPIPPTLTPVLMTDAAGAIETLVPGGGGPATLYLQCVSADASQVFGVEVSNALRVVLGT